MKHLFSKTFSSMAKLKKLDIYTDGACSGNPGPGGWAVLFKQTGKILTGSEKHTTNNRMELVAVIEALKVANFPCEIFCDSTYVVSAINKNWLKNWVKKDFRKVKNKDLWLQIRTLISGRDIKFTWVKAHSDNELNNLCDALATEACNKIKQIQERTD